MEAATPQEPFSEVTIIDGIKCYDVSSAYGTEDYPVEGLGFLLEI